MAAFYPKISETKNVVEYLEDTGVQSTDQRCNDEESGKRVMTIIPDTPSAEDEKQLLRKLDLTILPWIMLMYFLSYMDR